MREFDYFQKMLFWQPVRAPKRIFYKIKRGQKSRETVPLSIQCRLIVFQMRATVNI